MQTSRANKLKLLYELLSSSQVRHKADAISNFRIFCDTFKDLLKSLQLCPSGGIGSNLTIKLRES